MNHRDFAALAVGRIIADLSDRGGLGSVWDSIDDEVKGEIVETWTSAVAKAMPAETLRDTFAAAALQGLMAMPTISPDPEVVATIAYRYADAMLKAREGKP
jgi:uncharacterized protein YidB (DUF937 family)